MNSLFFVKDPEIEKTSLSPASTGPDLLKRFMQTESKRPEILTYNKKKEMLALLQNGKYEKLKELKNKLEQAEIKEKLAKEAVDIANDLIKNKKTEKQKVEKYIRNVNETNKKYQNKPNKEIDQLLINYLNDEVDIQSIIDASAKNIDELENQLKNETKARLEVQKEYFSYDPAVLSAFYAYENLYKTCDKTAFVTKEVVFPTIAVKKFWLTYFKGFVPTKILLFLLSFQWSQDIDILVSFPDSEMISMPPNDVSSFVFDKMKTPEGVMNLLGIEQGRADILAFTACSRRDYQKKYPELCKPGNFYNLNSKRIVRSGLPPNDHSTTMLRYKDIYENNMLKIYFFVPYEVYYTQNIAVRSTNITKAKGHITAQLNENMGKLLSIVEKQNAVILEEIMKNPDSLKDYEDPNITAYKESLNKLIQVKLETTGNVDQELLDINNKLQQRVSNLEKEIETLKTKNADIPFETLSIDKSFKESMEPYFKGLAYDKDGNVDIQASSIAMTAGLETIQGKGVFMKKSCKMEKPYAFAYKGLHFYIPLVKINGEWILTTDTYYETKEDRENKRKTFDEEYIKYIKEGDIRIYPVDESQLYL
jgi:hypothetical protein